MTEDAAPPTPPATPETPARRRLDPVWALIALLIVLVIASGWAIFRTVREPRAKPWDYGTVPFVPAESHYSSSPVQTP